MQRRAVHIEIPMSPTYLQESLAYRKAPFGIAVVNSRNGYIIHANDTYCAMLGRTAAQVIGQTWMRFTHPDDVAHDHYTIFRMYESKATQAFATKRYVSADGSVVHARVTVTPFNDENGEQTHMVMVLDETRHVRMREELKLRNEELRVSREEVLNALVVVSRFRDRETGDHLWRTSSYVRVLFETLREAQPFSRQGIKIISSASMLHDIGKIGIPDAILLKEGSLTGDEMRTMQTHTTLGANALIETMRHLRGDSSMMFAREIAEFHHERWDGFGYPYGLRGSAIPLTARVMAVADVYDALRSDRPYKNAYSHETSLKMIEGERGTHFDPEIVDAFLEKEKVFEDISETTRKQKTA